MRAKRAQITKIFITWVPVSSTGMTEFFYKNSVFIYCDKLLFITVLDILTLTTKNPRHAGDFFILSFDASTRGRWGASDSKL